MHVDTCIILSADYLLNKKMRTLAHLILAFAIWLAVHMETAKAFGVPPNITMAVAEEVGELMHMHVHLAMCTRQRKHAHTHSLARQNQPSRLPPHAHMLSASIRMSCMAIVCARVRRHTYWRCCGRCCGACNNDQRCRK